MTEGEIAQLLREVEARLDLFELEVDGWSAWQLLRFPVATELARSAPSAPATRGPAGRAELIWSGVVDWARYLRLPRARVLAKSFASALAEIQSDGRYRDVFLDDVLDVAGPGVKLEVQNARRPVGAIHIPPLATTRGVDLGAHVLSRLDRSRKLAGVARPLADAISTEFGVAGFDPLTVERRLLAFRGARRMYGRILDVLRPELVLVADTGEFELFSAAKERGIRCVELQHGIFTREHPHALGTTAAAHREQLIVPDALLLFGTYWEDELRAGGFYRDELRVTGSPRIDRFRIQRDVRPRSRQTCRVIATSQGIATGELAGFLEETISLARATGFDCRLDVKLHPIYDALSRKIYESLLGGGDVRILASDERPSTLELLSAADAHVSISSACHYESLGIGVPTIVLPLPGYEQVLQLVDAGHAALAATPAELLQRLMEAREQRVPQDVSRRYYRPGALERIAEELGRTGETLCL